jgi:hypothetical protein
MRISKENKQRIGNLLAGVIDCNYMIKRLEDEGKHSETETWINYRNDLLTTANKIKTNQ